MESFARPGSSQARDMKGPDGRQTRIVFLQADSPAEAGIEGRISRKGSFDWWHVLTTWIRQGKPGQDRKMDAFSTFLSDRGYSVKTRSTYLYMLGKFFNYLEERRVKTLTTGIVEDFNYDFFVTGNYSRSYQLQFINALSRYVEFAFGVKVSFRNLRKAGPVRRREIR